MFNHSHIRHFSSVFVSLRDFELITQDSSENITSRQSRCIYVNGSIEIINNTRGGIVIFLTEKKGNAFFGGQIQVPDAGPGADWLS